MVLSQLVLKVLRRPCQGASREKICFSVIGDWGEHRGGGGGRGKVGFSKRNICRCYSKGYITEMI